MAKRKSNSPVAEVAAIEQVPTILVALSEIFPCSIKNYREYFPEAELQELAASIQAVDVIQDILLRPAKDGNGYELVFGERRYRASKLAGKTHIPAKIKNLSDEKVREMQLTENLQRENPHPLREGFGIKSMLDGGKPIKQIAKRLGKSEAYIYQRLKLTCLIEPFQEMFLCGVMAVKHAYEIAELSPESQQDFFTDKLSNWKERGNFHISNHTHYLGNYKCDLKKAPFDTKDKNLLPEMGACTKCQYNSATVSSLFPEDEKSAVCRNMQCYQQKCALSYRLRVTEGFATETPAAIVLGHNFPDELNDILREIPAASEIPVYSLNSVRVLEEPEKPEMPEPEEYEDEDDEDRDTWYEDAKEEYEQEIKEYEALCQSGNYIKGLFFSMNRIELILFTERTEDDKRRSGQQRATAKEVQEAIKAGTATPELLRGEIGRLQQREEDNKRRDVEKIHANIYDALKGHEASNQPAHDLTPADHVAIRFVLYDALDWSDRGDFRDIILGEDAEPGDNDIYAMLEGLTEQQVAMLARMVMLHKNSSKQPRNLEAVIVRAMAGSIDVDIPAIEAAQQRECEEREERMNDKIKKLNKRIAKLEPAPAPADEAVPDEMPAA